MSWWCSGVRRSSRMTVSVCDAIKLYDVRWTAAGTMRTRWPGSQGELTSLFYCGTCSMNLLIRSMFSYLIFCVGQPDYGSRNPISNQSIILSRLSGGHLFGRAGNVSEPSVRRGGSNGASPIAPPFAFSPTPPAALPNCGPGRKWAPGQGQMYRGRGARIL